MSTHNLQRVTQTNGLCYLHRSGAVHLRAVIYLSKRLSNHTSYDSSTSLLLYTMFSEIKRNQSEASLLHTKPLLKSDDPLWKERIYSQLEQIISLCVYSKRKEFAPAESKFFSFTVDNFSEAAKAILTVLSPERISHVCTTSTTSSDVLETIVYSQFAACDPIDK